MLVTRSAVDTSYMTTRNCLVTAPFATLKGTKMKKILARDWQRWLPVTSRGSATHARIQTSTNRSHVFAVSPLFRACRRPRQPFTPSHLISCPLSYTSDRTRRGASPDFQQTKRETMTEQQSRKKQRVKLATEHTSTKYS